MELLYLVTSALFYFIAFVFTFSLNHDEFLKQAHFHELGIQIQYMHEKLFEQCPDVFQTIYSASGVIIGRRQSVDTSLDLEIELAEKTLEDLKLKFGNCTTITSSTANYFTTPDSLYTTTPMSKFKLHLLDSDKPLQPPFKLRNSKWCSVSILKLKGILKRLAKALIRLRVCAG